MITNTQKISYAFSLFKRAYAGYKLQILTTTILGFISGLASGIGISMLIPIFSLVTKQSELNTGNKLSEIVEKVFNLLHLNYSLPFVLMFMIFLFIVKALISLITTYMNERISGQYLEEMRLKSYGETLLSEWSYIMNQKIGYADRIITEDSTYGTSILKNISETTLRFTTLAAYAFIALNISVLITTLSFILGGLIFLFLKPYFFKMRKLSEFLSQASKDLSHRINESLIGIKTIKAFAVEPQVLSKIRPQFREMREKQARSAFLHDLQGILFEPAAFVFISAVFAFSYKSSSFNIVSFVVIIYLIQKIFSFIQSIQGKLSVINSSLPYLENMLKYQETIRQHTEKSVGNNSFKFKGSLNAHGITFTYPETKNKILSDISFSIQKGGMVGIIGPSGAGKTTLVDILLRLLKLDDGKITIDDIDINSINLNSWRKNIGYVSQDVFLLNDTIEVNIQFYDDSITHNDVLNASKTANIYNFIEGLPDKFNSLVGERGVKLSGGQKQRIALARVLAKKPSILILDEATSALDNESEALIQQSIGQLKGKMTILVIAHRLSTVMNSDSIIVLENGKIVEIGAPSELMKNEESYLYKSYHISQNNDNATILN